MRPRSPTRTCEDRRDRRGFTLIELLIVTVILGILAMIMAAGLTSARERSMIAAAKADVREAIHGVEIYRVTEFTLPADLEALVEGGFFTSSGAIRYCTFELRTDDSGADIIRIEAHHERSSTLVSAEYPTEGLEMTESPLDGAECSPAPQRSIPGQDTN